MIAAPPLLILALGFANPLILWGLAAASLPILLHLLNRRRYREESWAAMRFLLAAVRKNQRRIRFEHWLLLLVRVLLVACLVMAMGQPFLESIGAIPLLASRRTHRVIVIDASMSMTLSNPEGSRFDRALRYADAYVQGARNGDAVSVVLMGQPPEVVIGAPSPNRGEVREELEQLRPYHGTGDLLATLGTVREILRTSDLPQREVLVLSDLQANTWDVGPEGASELSKVVQGLDDDRANCVVVDLGTPDRANRAVVGLEIDTPVAVRGGPSTLVTARIASFGDDADPNVRAQLVVDGRLGPDRPVDLPPGQEASVAFSYQFEEPGDHIVEVRLDGDRLEVDDQRRLAVPVREHLQVLLVNGDYDPEPFESETDYLAQALSPSEGSDRAPSTIVVDSITESQLSRRDLDRVDVLFLCNIARLSSAEGRSIDRFLRAGGGVVVFGGDRVQAEEYNAKLLASPTGEPEGSGFLPARYGGIVDAGDAEGNGLASAPEFDPMDFEHPIVSAFGGAAPQVVAGLTGVRSWRSHELVIPEGSAARVALAFTDGRPAIVAGRHGRGVVLQVATTADADWTTWPLHPSFPPVVEQMALFAARGRMAQRNVQVGQPFDQALPLEAASSRAIVVRPDDVEEPGRLVDDGEGARLLFEETVLAGVYTARIGPPIGREFRFAANPDPLESDLATIDASTLNASLPGWRVSSWDGGPIDRSTAASVGRRGELHRGLLLLVLGLVLGESTLAWSIGRRR